MAKIGFVNLCHADYVDENALRYARMASDALKNSGVDLYNIEEPVVDYKTARAAGNALVSAMLDGIVLFLGTWIECPNAMAVVREIEHLPMCLWGFPMFMQDGALNSTGSYVSYTMFKGSMDRLGYRYEGIIGLPEDEITIKKVLEFCSAASAMAAMKRLRIGLVGYTSMGIYTGTFDHVLMRGKIGPEILHYDSYTIINRAMALKEDAFVGMLKELKAKKVNSDVSEDELINAARFTQALKDICEEDGLDGMNVKCQYEFSKEFRFVMCVPLSLLADHGIVTSCEGDMMCTVSMAALHLLSGNTVTYGDSINSEGNVLKLSSCGFMPFSMGVDGEQEIRKFLPHPGFSGIQCSFVQRSERVTVMRLIEDVGSYHILYFTGQGLDTQLRQGCMPALDVRLDGDIEAFLREANGQHYAICYGDASREIECYAKLMGIKAVRV